MRGDRQILRSYDSSAAVDELLSLLRLLVGNAHQPEGIGPVAGPVMLRTKPDVALLVFFLVIPTQRVSAALRGLFIEPDRREQPPCSLNPLHRRLLALVLHHLDTETSRANVILELVSGQVIDRGPVMRKIAAGRTVAILSEPLEMSAQWLADLLVVVQHADLRADELGNPDRGGVPRAYVPEALVFHQRVGSDFRYP